MDKIVLFLYIENNTILKHEKKLIFLNIKIVVLKLVFLVVLEFLNISLSC